MAEQKKEKKLLQGAETTQNSPKKVYRSKNDKMIAGICGGFAQYFNFDPTVVRVLWAVSIFAGGIGVIAYLLSWFIIPENPGEEEAPGKVQSKPNNSGLIWGGILIVLGGIILINRLDWFDLFPFHFRWHWTPMWFGHFRFDILLPIIIIIIGAIYIIRISKKDKQSNDLQVGQPMGGIKMDKKLTRSVKDRMISGVCGGVAEYFNIDSSIVRVVWAILTLAGGGFLGVIAYIVMLIVVPEESVIESTGTGTKTAPPKSKNK